MGLVARVVEESGIPTMVVATGRDLTAQVRPPRSLFVNFPKAVPDHYIRYVHNAFRSLFATTFLLHMLLFLLSKPFRDRNVLIFDPHWPSK